MRVRFDRDGLQLDGTRKLVRAAPFHYFRAPSIELWRDRIGKMAAAGLNTIEVVYPWSYHSAGRGDYDFSGFRDIDRLHDIIEEMGLSLIASPGPFVGSHLDFGGLPAWLLRERNVVPRCRLRDQVLHSPHFLDAVGEWFEQIVPRFASRPNLILVQVEHDYALPSPFSGVPFDLWDLLLRWLGSPAVSRLVSWPDRQRRAAGQRVSAPAARDPSQDSNLYLKELHQMVRELGVEVPIAHSTGGTETAGAAEVDLVGLIREPLSSSQPDWRDDAGSFDVFTRDEARVDALVKDQPVLYARLQATLADPWAGGGYERLRGILGSQVIENTTKAALAQRATAWTYSGFCGGTTWGYMGSPDTYTSYDLAAPVSEAGTTGVAYEAVRRLNEFLDRFEDDLVQTRRVEEPRADRWCSEHLLTRESPSRRFVFLRNPSSQARLIPTPERERAELAPWETQIRVYARDGRLEGISPEPVVSPRGRSVLPPPLPRLERWTFSGASPQLDVAYDDSGWAEISADQVDRAAIDMDSLGVHYGFVWYRGTFLGRLDRLLLDARHCYAVWINRQRIAARDQFQNRSGVGPDGARQRRISLRTARFKEGHNVLVVLVESLGHHQGIADDAASPRGIVSVDTGQSSVSWRYRGGLLRGERGMNPVVAFEGVERTGTEEVVLPHGWAGDPQGVALYETSFRLEGLDSKQNAVLLGFDPGRGKANLYLNGHLIGRYWPERGPQSRFLLPWGLLDPDGENHLAVALWKRTERAALGKLRLEIAQG